MLEKKDTELTFPYNHNYIYMIYTCRTILTGNWQKDSYTTKAVRIIHIHTHTHTIRQDKKKSDKVRTCASGKGFTGKGRVHGCTLALESEQSGPQIGFPIVWVPHRKDKPPQLVGELPLCQQLPGFPQLPYHAPQPKSSELSGPICFILQHGPRNRTATTREVTWPLVSHLGGVLMAIVGTYSSNA